MSRTLGRVGRVIHTRVSPTPTVQCAPRRQIEKSLLRVGVGVGVGVRVGGHDLHCMGGARSLTWISRLRSRFRVGMTYLHAS